LRAWESQRDRNDKHQEKNMKKFVSHLAVVVVALTIGCLIGCSSSKSPDVAGLIRQSLNQAGLSDVSVSQDRDKGVITLGGHVTDDSAKAQAETIARSNAAGGAIVANEISVTPPGAESQARSVSSDLDDGIKNNLDAALIQNNLHKSVKYDVKNGVVTLSGDVRSEGRRNSATAIASGVPNVQQVVNELQVKDQKATSTN
jgi:hyperosmotically inducible periplasmic protein